MPLSALILSFTDSAILQFFWVAGFAIILICFCGFLLLRRRGVIQSAPAENIPAQSSPSTEVVRLSPEPVPINTSEMSQQQKIAAALMRAGMSNPAAWSTGGVATADATSPADDADHSSHSAR